MRYETERLSFSLLALCGDHLASVRQKLAANIRSLAELEAKQHHDPGWESKTTQDIIRNPTDERLSSYQLDEGDIQAVPESEIKKAPLKPQESSYSGPSSSSVSISGPPPPSPASSTINGSGREAIDAALKLWVELGAEQKRIVEEYDKEVRMAGQDSLGRTKDYTAAVHEWVGKLADHGVLKRLHREVQD